MTRWDCGGGTRPPRAARGCRPGRSSVRSRSRRGASPFSSSILPRARSSSFSVPRTWPISTSPAAVSTRLAGQPLEQRRAELGFKRQDLPVHRGGRHVEPGRRFADRPCPRHFVEIGDQPTVQHVQARCWQCERRPAAACPMMLPALPKRQRILAQFDAFKSDEVRASNGGRAARSQTLPDRRRSRMMNLSRRSFSQSHGKPRPRRRLRCAGSWCTIGVRRRQALPGSRCCCRARWPTAAGTRWPSKASRNSIKAAFKTAYSESVPQAQMEQIIRGYGDDGYRPHHRP